MDVYLDQIKKLNFTAFTNNVDLSAFVDASDAVSAFLNNTPLPYKEIVLGISWVIYLFQQYLCYRQHRNLANPKLGVPKALTKFVTAKEHQKSKAYGLDKSRFAFVSSLFSQIQTSAVIHYDILPYLWNLSQVALTQVGLTGQREILQSVVFVVITLVASMFINLPFSIYSTFVIEEKHGFNKNTPWLFFTDLVKELILTVALTGIFVPGLLKVIQWGGPKFFFYVWLFMMGFQFVMLLLVPTIQGWFNKFTPLPEGPLRTEINKLAARIKFPLTKIFVVDGSRRSSHSNAYFFGFFKNKRIVLFDTLVEQCTQDEILAILAHELGHWQLNHTFKLLMLNQIQLFTIFYLFSHFISLSPMYQAFGFLGQQPIIVGLLLFMYLYQPVDFVLTLVMNSISRRFEFQADFFAKKLGYAKLLVDGLIKIHKKNLGNLNPDNWYSAWHYTHPPLVERLAAIGKTE
ncbi:CAAX prenyl protease 1 [Chytridiales sp. JEL 0842]|nr:CAAX prenyl protease 1 [Chytridiales sp. JEL 0842]